MSSVKPLVSIIMPTYNASQFIQESIESIISQTYENWELFIVNDCSTDSTEKIIKYFSARDTRIHLIQRNTNGGRPSIAKNTALPYIQGVYLAFLDSDDLWLNSKLEIQVKYMMNNPDYALTYTSGFWIDQYGKIIKQYDVKYQGGKNLKKMLQRYEINNQSVMMKIEALTNTIERFNENITIGEDYNLFMHVVAQYDVSSINEPLIKYRIHNEAITKKIKQISDGVLITLHELNNLYNIKRKYPFIYFFTYLKAIRFKYIKKLWR